MDAWKIFRGLTVWSLPLVASAVASLSVLVVLIGWVSVSGTSALACAAGCLAVASGAAGATLIDRATHRRRALAAVALIGTVLMTVVAPVAFDTCLTIAASHELPETIGWLAAALPMIPAAIASILLFRLPAHAAPRRRVGGVIVGTALFALHTWVAYPFTYPAVVLTCWALIGLVSNDQATASAERRSGALKLQPSCLLLNGAMGLGLVAATMILNRVFTVSYAAISGGIVFTAVAALIGISPFSGIKRRPWRVWVCCLLVLAILPLCYSAVIDGNLRYLASTTTGTNVILFHAFQLSAWWVLLLAAGLSALRATGLDSQQTISPPAICIGAAAAWLLTGTTTPVGLMLVALSGIASIPIITLWKTPAVSRKFRLLRWCGSTAAAAAVVTLIVAPPDLAAPSNLNFNTRSLVAIQRGVNVEMIPETDAARLITSSNSAVGTITTWKSEANLLQLRVNGHTVGEASTNTLITPQPPAEVLTCILPLVLHDNAGSVLLMDDHSGVAQDVCEQFPLHRLAVARSTAENSIQPLVPRQDQDHIQVYRMTPEAAIRSEAIDSVDVVISMLTDPVCPESLSRLSTAWFQAAADRLSPGGLLCQRVRHQHIGDDSLIRILSNASSAFQHIALVQLVPGEIAVIATNSDRPLLDKELLARMERQHVRRQLSRCGWDWCQLAALAVVDSTDPVGLWEHQQFPAPTMLTTGHLNLQLGLETARPGLQWTSLRQLLAPHERRIAEAVPRGPQHEEFRRRISAYAQQVEVLTAFPDEPWIYRKSLRSEMQRNQRPPVELFENGRKRQLPHPLDQHRKNYFETLGALLKKLSAGTIEAQDLQRLSEFSADYEPLISDFVHHELVRIHELAGNPLPAEEFQHRLHTVNYTQPGDYSVRNVIAALDQLTKQPEVMDSEADRFDQLNTLIQQLIVRWEARTHFEPRSAVRMQRDVELSVHTVQTALMQMEKLAPSVGMRRSEYLTRRRFVSEALIGPLREYKQQVLAHRAKTEPMLVSEEDIDEGFDHLPMLLDQPATN